MNHLFLVLCGMLRGEGGAFQPPPLGSRVLARGGWECTRGRENFAILLFPAQTPPRVRMGEWGSGGRAVGTV